MKNWANILTRLLLVLCIVIAGITFHNLRNATTELNSVNQIADSLRQERELLNRQYNELSMELDSARQANVIKSDSLIHYLYLVNVLTVQNDSLKQTLLNVPDDTIYIRMQETVPTQLPLIYPFSGPQIRFYYATYIETIGNRKLITAQETALKSCVDYSLGLGTEIDLLNNANANLGKQIILADLQTSLYKDSAEKLTNKLSNVKKREKLLTIGGLVVGYLLGR